MATFEEQVEGLLSTNLSIAASGSAISTQSELTQFLKDGVKEVVSRIVELKPQEAHLFAKETSITTTTGYVVLDDSKVSDVWRENGTAGQYEAATQIPARDRYRATDPNSLSYRSKFNPGWYKDKNKLYVVPTPAAAGIGKVIVNHIDYSQDIVWGHSSGGLEHFPIKYEYLLVLYAAMRVLHAMMSSNEGDYRYPDAPSTPDAPGFVLETVTEENVDSVTVGSVSVGTDTSVSSVVLASPSIHTLSAPTYTKPTIATRVSFEDFWNTEEDNNPFGDNDPGEFAFTAVMPDEPSITSVSYTGPSVSTAGAVSVSTSVVAASNVYTGSAPTYTKPTQVFDIEKFEEFLETEEDSELAQIQLGRLNHELQEWQSDIQNELNEFNKDNALYQAAMQESMQEIQVANQSAMKQADVDLQLAISNSQESNKLTLQNAVTEMQKIIADNEDKIKEYNAQVQAYNAEIQAEAQEYTNKMSRYQVEMQTALSAWQQTQGFDLQIYNSDIQNELNEFNKENVAFQASIQEEIQNLQVASARVQKQADIEVAEVQKQADIDLQKAIKDSDYALQKTITDTSNDMQTKIHNSAKDLEMQISEYTQVLGKYNADIQKYSIQFQETSTQYKQAQDQYNRLRAEYDAAFMIGQINKEQPRERKRR